MRRWFAFAAAGFAFLFASTGQDALSSCGDYVMVGGTHDHDMNRSSPSPASPNLPTCSGPLCQRQAPPLHAPDRLVESGPHESACTLFAAGSHKAEPSARVYEPAQLTSQAVTVPPDRPPRASR